jgi:hypothetical protein
MYLGFYVSYIDSKLHSTRTLHTTEAGIDCFTGMVLAQQLSFSALHAIFIFYSGFQVTLGIHPYPRLSVERRKCNARQKAAENRLLSVNWA